MSTNGLLNPGFESVAPMDEYGRYLPYNWHLRDSIYSDPAPPLTENLYAQRDWHKSPGSYGMYHYYQQTGPWGGGGFDSICQIAQLTTLYDLEPRYLEFWVLGKPLTPRPVGSTVLRVQLFEDTWGVLTATNRTGTVLYQTYVGFEYYWQRITSPWLTIQEPKVALIVEGWNLSNPGPPYPATSAHWITDAYGLYKEASEEMTKRQEIRDNAVAALETISALTGRVRTEVRRPDKIEGYPEAHVLYGDEDRSHNEMHRKKGRLRLHIFLWARDAATSAENQLDELVADVEQKLEAQTLGSWLSLSYIEQVSVVGVIPFEVDSDAQGGVRVYRVDVQIDYRYNRLSP